MKNVLLFFAFFPAAVFSQTLDAKKAFRLEAESMYPGLTDQMNHVLTYAGLRLDGKNISQKLDRILLSNKNQEFQDSFRFVLQNSSHRPETSGAVRIDGKASDWAGISAEKLQDKRGDGFSGSDLSEIRAAMDDKGNLILGLETHGGIISENRWYVFYLDYEGSTASDLEFAVFIDQNRSVKSYLRRMKDQSPVNNLNPEIAVGQILEAKLPYRLLPDAGNNFRPSITVYTVMLSQDLKQRDDIASLNIPLYNSALALYLHLLENGAYAEEDSMTAAIASRWGNLLQRSNDETRPLILSDSIELFQYYQKISDWQTKSKFPYRTRTLPFDAKLFWADPENSVQEMNPYDTVDSEFYDFYVIRPALLNQVFREIEKKNLTEGITLREILKAVDSFGWENQRYHWPDIEYTKLPADEKKLVDTKKEKVKFRSSEYGYWALPGSKSNVRWYFQYGFYSGSCGMQAMLSRTFYQALGIPSFISFYHTYHMNAGRKKYLDGKSHTFPLYFDAASGRWLTIQGAFIAPALVKLLANPATDGFDYKFFLPHTHPNIPLSGLTPEYFSLTHGDLENIMRYGFRSSDVFTPARNEIIHPDLITYVRSLSADSEGDMLPDILEKELGLNSNQPDTDHDGASDYHEIISGSDPGKKDSTPAGPVFVDGFALEQLNEIAADAEEIQDQRNDSLVKINSFDIASLSGTTLNGYLYLRGKFHNQVQRNRYLQHEFWIRNDSELLWVACHGWNNCRSMVSKDGKNWSDIVPISMAQFAVVRDMELLLPLDILGNWEKIDITYSVMSGPPGKEVRNSDEVNSLKLAIPGSARERSPHKSGTGRTPANINILERAGGSAQENIRK